MQKDAYHDAAVMVREIESRAKDEADKKARNIIALAIQKCAADHVAETTVSVVALPNDDMKGRIIGREGRNIRTLETATGVDLIIDDTPEAVIISAFDPVRREIARIALEKLIMDGRIHPARIEEMVEKATPGSGSADPRGRRAGRVRDQPAQHPSGAGQAAGPHALPHQLWPERAEPLHRGLPSGGRHGRRTGLRTYTLAKRAGLLHDIGKAIDHEVEGTHVTIGAELAKKFHEKRQGHQLHHGPPRRRGGPACVEAVLVQAADAISAARPGARRESLENYIKRLEKLEAIAYTFEGVDTCYAIQSGREDAHHRKARRCERRGHADSGQGNCQEASRAEMEYPGQIKVNVIRETRSVEFAK